MIVFEKQIKFRILCDEEISTDVSNLIIQSGGYSNIPQFSTNKKELIENNGLY